MLSLDCFLLPERVDTWPDSSSTLATFLKDSERREGILWIMVKPDPQGAGINPTGPILRSKFFFSTSGYAEVPNAATDLFLPLVHQIRDVWNHNFEVIAESLSLMVGRLPLFSERY